MDDISVEYPTDWTDYELIDSGSGEKLERFARYTIARPDPRAIWEKAAPDAWSSAQATYIRTDSKSGHWDIQTQPPYSWKISWKHLTFTMKPTEFKHVGVFPEQAVNWAWLADRIGGKPINVLNLFAYTGGATMAAAAAGGRVTHVDSVKSAVTWANENMAASGLTGRPVRWIVEDAYKFVLREAKRGNTYDAIIMDPPRFGRGSQGEVWKIEEDLPKMFTACREILSSRPAFFLINAYTADLSSLVLKNLLGQTMRQWPGQVTSGELALKESSSERLLPNGIFARWSPTRV